MSLAAGTRFGSYEILGLIGAGGMGEVYKAHDTRLDRVVAIKMLPAAAAGDGDRRSRFEREAKAVAALNHPNIVTIHAVEEADGVPFFTMEYVEGRTIAQVIPSNGLPLEELLRIAIPLTDAVGAAHQRGILHRDLKPANVMITGEGRVKVLDFGLAKLKEVVVTADAGSRPTIEATGEGRILGTVAYMSPEQAEGKALDQRSDVFSLGILLYEMATGQRPFKGDTSVSVISAILKDAPGSVANLRPDLPRDLGKILKRALNKDPEHRYQTAKDLRNDLEMLKEDLDSGEAFPSPTLLAEHRRRPSLLWIGAIVLLVGAVAAGTWWLARHFQQGEQSRQAPRFFDDFTVAALTTEGVAERAVAVSPDGRYVAYVFVEGGREGLRVRQPDTSATVQVVPPSDVRYFDLTFSPDGNRLYYIQNPGGTGFSTLYEVAVLGGTPHRLIHDVDSGISFSPDGSRFTFFRNFVGKSSSILIANADGTGERVLANRPRPEEFSFVSPVWSDDGRTIAAVRYDGFNSAIVTIDAMTGTVQPVGRKRWYDVTSLAWPRGESRLVAAARDLAAPDTSQLWDVTLPGGEVRRLTKDIASYTKVSVTADGRTLVTVRSEWRGTLWVAPSSQPDRAARIGSVPETVAQQPVRWTADGRILFTANVSGNDDIWTVAADGGDLRQLTTSPAPDRQPTVTPDGRYIVFVSLRDERMRIYRMDPDGGRQTVLSDGTVDQYPVVAADSRNVYYARVEQPDEPVYMVAIDGGQPVALSGAAATSGGHPTIPAYFHPHELSPDGSLIVGSQLDSKEGRTHVVVVDERGNVRKPGIVLSLSRERSFAWAPDGRSITFAQTTADGASNLWRQRLDGGAPSRVTNYPAGQPIVAHAWSRDGKLLALVRGTSESRVVRLRDAASGR